MRVSVTAFAILMAHTSCCPSTAAASTPTAKQQEQQLARTYRLRRNRVHRNVLEVKIPKDNKIANIERNKNSVTNADATEVYGDDKKLLEIETMHWTSRFLQQSGSTRRRTKRSESSTEESEESEDESEEESEDESEEESEDESDESEESDESDESEESEDESEDESLEEASDDGDDDGDGDGRLEKYRGAANAGGTKPASFGLPSRSDISDQHQGQRQSKQPLALLGPPEIHDDEDHRRQRCDDPGARDKPSPHLLHPAAGHRHGQPRVQSRVHAV